MNTETGLGVVRSVNLATTCRSASAALLGLLFSLQGGTPINIQFDPISWMCLITEVVSLLLNEPGKDWIFHGNAKLEDWP
jgi:hypothetical protein